MTGSNSTPNRGYPYNNETTDPFDYPAASGEQYLLPIDTDIADIIARLTALETAAQFIADDWTTYTPGWTSLTGSNPTPASHSLTGRWRKVDAKLAVVQFRLVGASASGWGTGVYGFGLPWAITTSSRDMSVGAGHLTDSGTADYPCTVRCHDVNTVRMHYATTGNLGATTPVTLTTSDVVFGQILVEPA